MSNPINKTQAAAPPFPIVHAPFSSIYVARPPHGARPTATEPNAATDAARHPRLAAKGVSPALWLVDTTTAEVAVGAGGKGPGICYRLPDVMETVHEVGRYPFTSTASTTLMMVLKSKNQPSTL